MTLNAIIEIFRQYLIKHFGDRFLGDNEAKELRAHRFVLMSPDAADASQRTRLILPYDVCEDLESYPQVLTDLAKSDALADKLRVQDVTVTLQGPAAIRSLRLT